MTHRNFRGMARGAMNKTAWVGLTALLVSANLECKPSSETVPEPSPRAATAPSAAPQEASRSLPLRVVEAPPSGPVEGVVRQARVDALSEGRTLVVYVGATWCEPCQRFHQAAERGELDSDLPNVTLFEFDLDRDRERLASAGYVSTYIPLFVLPTADGAASDRRVEGGIKGAGAVGFILPRLKAMLLR